MLKSCVLALLIIFSLQVVFADETRPLTGKPDAPKKEEKNKKPKEKESSWPTQTWQMPAETIYGGQNTSGLKEEELIGSYNQPRWTAHRRFAGTRIYVRPEKEISVEFWSFAKIKKHDAGTKHFNQVEIEFGLPNRFQFDLYLTARHESGSGETKYDISPEIRYALADWGEFWGNPTLYIEYKFQEDTDDVVETKLLLGDELAPHWHWGTNFVWEQETGGAKESILELTNAIGYTLIDERLSVGLEAKSEIANEAGSRDHWSNNIRVGPSIQYKPIGRMHIDLVAIFGVTSESRLADVFFVAGYEF